MNGIEGIFESYSDNMTISALENFETCSFNLSFSRLKKKISYLDIVEFKKLISERDSVNTKVILDGSEPYFISKEEDLNDLNASFNVDDGLQLSLLFDITKKSVNNTLSIYCLQKFLEFLLEKNMLQLLNILDKHLNSNVLNKWEIVSNNETKIIFRSTLIAIYYGSYEHNQVINNSERDAIIYNRNLYSNLQNLSRHWFLPSDFNNLEENDSESQLNLLLEKIKIMLSIAFLSNNSFISESGDVFTFGLNDTRYLTYKSSFENLLVSEAKSLYDIYKWVFEEGFLYDKLAISRLIVTNYFTQNDNEWYLIPDAIFAVQSAHNLYLKENVEKYIEIKNRMAEFSLELSLKTKEIASDFIRALKNNHLTLVTFFISLFIFNALSGNLFSDIFTRDITVISYILIAISYIYLVVTILQMNQDIDRHKERFFNVREIYKDTLTANELVSIFKEEIVSSDINYIRKSMSIYSSMWMAE